MVAEVEVDTAADGPFGRLRHGGRIRRDLHLRDIVTAEPDLVTSAASPKYDASPAGVVPDIATTPGIRAYSA